mmetsp:Transcript_2924/g.8243  ORF Transcript_2924/g.8243 Transcript_2924/m.8243 type:complete len:217 (+) Transcript_2924:728-1378(+)
MDDEYVLQVSSMGGVEHGVQLREPADIGDGGELCVSVEVHHVVWLGVCRINHLGRVVQQVFHVHSPSLHKGPDSNDELGPWRALRGLGDLHYPHVLHVLKVARPPFCGILRPPQRVLEARRDAFLCYTVPVWALHLGSEIRHRRGAAGAAVHRGALLSSLSAVGSVLPACRPPLLSCLCLGVPLASREAALPSPAHSWLSQLDGNLGNPSWCYAPA